MRWPRLERSTERRVVEILRSGRVNYWTGPVGREFEEAFAAWLGVRNAVSVLSGAAARQVAYLALGMLPPEDGAAKAQGLLVHAHGEVAVPRGRVLVEDCTECLGGMYRARKVGTFGRVSFFAFGADGTITAGGQGGMVCTDDDGLAWELRSIRDHGYDARAKLDLLKREGRTLYVHRRLGYNFRLTEIQSAIGLAELRRLDGWNLPRRRANGEALVAALRAHPLVRRTPLDTAARRNAFSCVCLELRRGSAAGAEELAAALRRRGIGATAPGGELLMLPTHPTMTAADVRRVIRAFGECAELVADGKFVSHMKSKNCKQGDETR